VQLNPVKFCEFYHYAFRENSCLLNENFGTRARPLTLSLALQKSRHIHSGGTWNKPQLGNLLLWLRFLLFLQPFHVDIRIVPSNRSWLLLAKWFNLVSNFYLFKGMIFLHVKIRRRQLHTTNKRNHWTLQTYNKTWAHKRGYTLELCSVTEVFNCNFRSVWWWLYRS
jgi:hypothetical protein